MARATVQPVTELADPAAEAGELAFRFGAGRPCLDLVLTVGERWRRSFERLRQPADLGRWLVDAGLVSPSPAAAAEDLAGARELREAIFGIARSAMDGVRPGRADVRVVNAWAARPDLRPALVRVGGPVRRGSADPVGAALSTLARDAVELFGSSLAGRVRECGAPDCSSVFLDRSRAGRRRWCSMAACGNRSKVAAYRRRRSAPARDRTGVHAARAAAPPGTSRGR